MNISVGNAFYYIYIYIYVHISSKIVHTKSYCPGYGFVILMDKKTWKKLKRGERRDNQTKEMMRKKTI